MHVDEDGLHRSDRAAGCRARPMTPCRSTCRWCRGRCGRSAASTWPTAASVQPGSRCGCERPALRRRRGPIHQALLAHATDLTLIGTALRPFDGVSQADSTVTLHTAVTSHTMWFHQPFRIDDWLLLAQDSPVVANGRAFGRGEVFTSAGEVVASFAQESMVRQIEAPS